ncbi:GNAT family N-acetyltransferase [Paenibacillus sp. J5C_2022]|uniref:GNAT family N-acetyltransferase n=1 Tax=Paenibacillus sp. J5C2022 TaxID=2977129 RepID=UPI0021D35E38|nr:GNAT family protein [Paenibacillus sp. J5C2022]MCU6713014.1 GNAT family N-acetyltransferase [Paenibacillus sp. J5C2022]
MELNSIYHDLPQLETSRTILRKIREIFIEKILDKYNNHTVAPWGIVDRATGWLIGTSGFVYWDTHHSKAEVAYALSRSYWNRGYMTEVMNHLVDFAFSEMKLIRLEGRCLVNNPGSARVLEKCGMQLEGIMRKVYFVKGAHQDLMLYAVVR